jgi:putative membrane protein
MNLSRSLLMAGVLLATACDNRTPVPPPKTSGGDREPAAATDQRSAKSNPQGTAGESFAEDTRDAGGTASADQPASESRELGAAALSAVDKLFLAGAVASGLAEVEASRLALKQAADPRVRDFARHMIKEHTRLNDELRRIAADKGIGIAPEVHGDPRDQLERLKGLSGPEFDAVFIKDFGFDGHKKATVLYEREIREGRDSRLKAFAEKALPELRDHQAMAEYLIIAASR